MKKLTLILFVASLAFVSCKKYENGPALSLRSKTKRLAGKDDGSGKTWKVSADRLYPGDGETFPNDWGIAHPKDSVNNYYFVFYDMYLPIVGDDAKWTFTYDDKAAKAVQKDDGRGYGDGISNFTFKAYILQDKTIKYNPTTNPYVLKDIVGWWAWNTNSKESIELHFDNLDPYGYGDGVDNDADSGTDWEVIAGIYDLHNKTLGLSMNIFNQYASLKFKWYGE